MNKLIFLNLLFFVNCITWTEYGWKQKDIEFQKNAKTSKSLLLNFTAEIEKDGEKKSYPTALEDNQRKSYEERINELNLFKEVNTGLARGDIKLHIHLIDRGFNNFWLNFLCGFSFFTIPTYATNDYEIKFSFKDNKDNLIKEYTRKIKYSSVIHGLLLPITPFMFPFVVYARGEKNTFESVFDEALKDEIFK